MPKYLFKTDYCSEEYWDGTTYALLTLDDDDLKLMRRLRKEGIEFLKRMAKLLDVSYVGSVQLNQSLLVEYFDDDDAGTAETLLDDESWCRVPDEFEIAKHIGATVEQAVMDSDKLCIHANGDLWLKSTSKHSGDYCEVNLPAFTKLQAAEIKSVSLLPATQVAA